MIYIAIYVALAISVCVSAGNPSLQRALTICWSVFLLLFIGLRRWVGCDYGGYKLIWDNFVYYGSWYAGEPGFSFVLGLLGQLGFDYSAFNLVFAAIFLFGLVVFAFRQKNSISVMALSFPIVAVHLAMSGVRQAAALAFVMVALTFAAERRRVMFVAMILLAGSFHYTALILLPLAALTFRNRSFYLLAALSLLWIVGVSYFGHGTTELYRSRYLDAAADAEPVAAGGILRVSTVAAAGLLFFVFARRSWKRNFPEDFDMTKYLAIGTLVLLPLTTMSSVVGDRLAYYLMPAQISIFARMPYLDRTQSSQLLLMLPYALLFGFLAVWLWLSPLVDVCYLPYDNHLFGDEVRIE